MISIKVGKSCLNKFYKEGQLQGRHFSFFQGGQNFDRLPRGGAKYKKYNIF